MISSDGKDRKQQPKQQEVSIARRGSEVIDNRASKRLRYAAGPSRCFLQNAEWKYFFQSRQSLKDAFRPVKAL